MSRAGKAQGFTLVELAIVIMIVGLLIGGILKGNEVVNQARTKNLLNDFNGVLASLLAYRDRYGANPGDDGQAGTRWATFGTKSGDSDGRIGGNYNDLPSASESTDPTAITIGANGAGESKLFWWHLRLAGFVVGPQQGPGAANTPVTAVGGIMGVQTGSTIPNFFSGFMACANDVPDQIAIAVDAQLDDLRPTQGQVRSLQQPGVTGSPPALSAGVSVADYIENGSRYIVCRQI
jgi:prepilin-type N-terminal cleavage/methylation domain-containing protein